MQARTAIDLNNIVKPQERYLIYRVDRRIINLPSRNLIPRRADRDVMSPASRPPKCARHEGRPAGESPTGGHRRNPKGVQDKRPSCIKTTSESPPNHLNRKLRQFMIELNCGSARSLRRRPTLCNQEKTKFRYSSPMPTTTAHWLPCAHLDEQVSKFPPWIPRDCLWEVILATQGIT